MNRRTRIIGLLCAMFGLVAIANAQEAPQYIRFVTTTPAGDVHWEGYVERLTADSLRLRVSDGDTSATFSRTAIRSVERGHRLHQGRAAGLGCAAGGTALGVLGLVGTHDPDSPGLEKTAGAIGAVLGCGAGAVVGLMVSASQHWEPWSLPDSIPSTAGTEP